MKQQMFDKEDEGAMRNYSCVERRCRCRFFANGLDSISKGAQSKGRYRGLKLGLL